MKKFYCDYCKKLIEDGKYKNVYGESPRNDDCKELCLECHKKYTDELNKQHDKHLKECNKITRKYLKEYEATHNKKAVG